MIMTDCDGEDEKNNRLAAPPASSAPDFGSAIIPEPQGRSGNASTLVRLRYRTAEAITPITLPAARGGDEPVVYSLTPDLSAVGLTFDAVARTLSGRPMSAMAKTLCTYAARDANGDAAKLEFTLTIELNQITALDQDLEPQRSIIGQAITALTLPEPHPPGQWTVHLCSDPSPTALHPVSASASRQVV